MGRGYFFTSITSDQHIFEEEEPDYVSFDFETPPLKIRSFSEVINSLDDVKDFLDAKGYSEQATVFASAVDMVASLSCSSLVSGRQSTLDDYFRMTEFHANNILFL